MLRFKINSLEENARRALDRLELPIAPDALRVEHGIARLVLTLDASRAAQAEALQRRCEEALLSVKGVTEARVVISAPTSPVKKAQYSTEKLPHVKRVIAIASGKGGVGKSTATAHLAFALAARGLRVGILDADIHGPSQPRMLGLREAGQPAMQDGVMQPFLAHGVAVMSVGFIAQDKAAIWRGPMVSKALHQMLRQTRWGSEDQPLDALLIDLPPGTGDIHLTLAQAVPLDGAVIVTTPQEMAVADAQKCAVLFQKINVPILGILENMSGFVAPGGTLHAIFGTGGGEQLAQETGAPLLAQIPLDLHLREAADAGQNYLAQSPEAAASQAWSDAAEKLSAF